MHVHVQAPHRLVIRQWNCADHPSHTSMNECDFECVTRDAVPRYAIQLHTLWCDQALQCPFILYMWQTFHHCLRVRETWHDTQCIYLLHAASICIAHCTPLIVTLSSFVTYASP